MMESIPLTIACGDYDRTRPLIDGRVPIEGCRPLYLRLQTEEMFFRAFVHEEFDVSELSLSSYLIRRSRGDCPYVGIPAFVSRTFRHSAIYVRTDRILRPEDLRGRVVGVPEYQVTAAVWVRGILQDDYGARPQDMRWVTGGLEMPGRVEKIALATPPGVSLEAAAEGQTLSGMLERGEIDALIAPRAPSCFSRGAPHIGRLFSDFGEVEEAYYRRTGIFPIMHLIGIKTELAARHPWLPASVYKAFAAAKDIAVAALSDPNVLAVSLPSLTWGAERARALMGEDFWTYGVAKNVGTLQVFLRYHFEQGLSARRLTPVELFAPTTASESKI